MRRLYFHHHLAVPVRVLAAAVLQECAAQGGGGDRAPLSQGRLTVARYYEPLTQLFFIYDGN